MEEERDLHVERILIIGVADKETLGDKIIFYFILRVINSRGYIVRKI